ncbi:MAG: SDR family oxidoreductase [Methanotrichaceae archaeon]|nr:SDR family oxidoreductase [Methanotrichaceae archaeon]
MRSKRVVVTGGAGFIGSNLTTELASAFDVTVIDNLSTGHIENLSHIMDEITFIKGSITDPDLLKEAFVDVDTIFHQGAIPSVQRSVDNPSATNEANVDGTLNVLVAARDCGARKVVFASSSSVYGDTPTLPKAEDMNPNPKSPYAVSKLAGEYYCRVFSEVYGLKTVCLRYFNVFGPRQDPRSEYAAVIPRFITRILDGMPPVIYGDGGQTRDFTFVGDVVKANMLAMKGDVQGVFNVACGQRISLNELAERIMEIAGRRIEPVYDFPRAGDVRDSLADISRARGAMGYAPGYDLESGLRETVEWFWRG